MDTNETNELSANVAGEPTGPSPETQTRPTPDQSWNRRGFLKAAALGAAVTGALFLDKDKAGRLHLGGAAALAGDLSDYPCTANDIGVGVGTIVNEPCCCPTGGTFPAVISFPVSNHTSAHRYCVMVHLPDGRDIGPLIATEGPTKGTGVVPPNSTINMAATLTGFPCNQIANSPDGKFCYGLEGQIVRGKCAPKTCGTVAFNTSATSVCPNDTPPRGQCRHQPICFQTFGVALQCGSCDGTSNATCTVNCGGTSSLHAKVTAAPALAGQKPFTYTLVDGNGNGVATVENTDKTCVDFQVTGGGTYAVVVCDSRLSNTDGTCGNNVETGCCRTSRTVTVTEDSITAELAVSNVGCNGGQLTFTASGKDSKGVALSAPVIKFQVDGGPETPGSGTNGNEFVYTPSLASGGGIDTNQHTVTAKVTYGNCCAKASRIVSQCVTSTVGNSNPGLCS